jgi:hypothetical protein
MDVNRLGSESRRIILAVAIVLPSWLNIELLPRIAE